MGYLPSRPPSLPIPSPPSLPSLPSLLSIPSLPPFPTFPPFPLFTLLSIPPIPPFPPFLSVQHSKCLSIAGCSVPSFYPVLASHTSSVSFIYIMTLVTSSASTKIGTNEFHFNLIKVYILDLISK